MKMPKALDRIMRSYTADREPFLGKGASGSTYGPVQTFPCYAEPIRARSRSTDQEVTRATCKIWTFLETEVNVGDKVSVGPWSGWVIGVADFSSRGTAGTPDHKEVMVG